MTFEEYIGHDMGAFGRVRIKHVPSLDGHRLVYDCAKGAWVSKSLDLISEDDGKDLGMSDEERDTVNAVHRRLRGGGSPLESWEFIIFNIGVDEKG